MEQILRKISKFPEILGELSMRKQCVPGSFSSTHALEPGNEAREPSNRPFPFFQCWTIEHRYTDFRSYLDFHKMRDVPGFRSAGHIYYCMLVIFTVKYELPLKNLDHLTQMKKRRP